MKTLIGLVILGTWLFCVVVITMAVIQMQAGKP